MWEEAAFLSNTFIFVLAGLIIADRVDTENTTFEETESSATVGLYMATSALLCQLRIMIVPFHPICSIQMEIFLHGSQNDD